jgi:hypothetical protein
MMLPLATVAAALSVAQTTPAQATPYNCQADLGMVDGGRIAWVNLLLDDNLRPARYELHVRRGRFDAAWQLGEVASSTQWVMQPSIYTVELPIVAVFPVEVRISGDGRLLWRGSFERSAGEIVHYPAMERFSSIVLVWGSGRPIADVFGIDRLDIAVRDARGAQILNERVPLPDWRWIDAGSRAALREVERQRAGQRCGLSAIP